MIYTQAESFLDTQLRVQFAKYLAPNGIHIDFRHLKIGWGLPLKLRLSGVSLIGGGLPQGEVEEVSLGLNWIGDITNWEEFYPDVGIEIKNPKFTWESKADTQEPVAPKLNSSAGVPIQSLSDLRLKAPQIKNLRFQFEVEGAQFEMKKGKERLVSIKDLHLKAGFEAFESPVVLNLAGLVKIEKSPLPIWLPVSLDASMKLEQGELSVVKAEAKVLSLAANLKGKVNLNTQEMQLQMQAEVPELEKVPVPTGYGLPFNAWKGALKASVSAEGSFQSPLVLGSLELLNSRLNLALENGDLKAAGPLVMGLQLDFKFSSTFEVRKLDGNLDLTATEISYEKLFKKPADVPLRIGARGRTERLIYIDVLSVKLAQLEAEVSGSIDLGQRTQWPASLRVNIRPTNLVGLENFFLPLSQHLMTGSVSLNGTIRGDLKQPSMAKVMISELALKKFSTQVKYQNSEMILDGPVAMNLEGTLDMENLNVQAGTATLFADLSGMRIKYLNLFSKKQNEMLKVNLKAEKKGNKLTLRSSELGTFAGLIQISGEPPLGVSAPMALQLDCKSLSLNQIRSWFPSHQMLIPDGESQFSVSLVGRLDPEAVLRSSLAVKATVGARISKLSIVKSEPAETVTTVKAKPKPPEAFLNPDPLLKLMQLNLNLALGELELAALRAQGINLKAEVREGMVSSSLSIQRVFDGSMTLPRFKLNLFQKDPVIGFEFSGQKLKIEKMLSWALPQYERLIRGEADLTAVGNVKLPWAPDFVESVDAGGDLRLENGVLNTVELGEMFKGLMSSIPGLDPQVIAARGPLQAKMSARFRVKEAQVNLSPFQAITARKEELFLKGGLDSNLNMDLVGSLFLREALSGPFYEANKDAEGRLEIPLQLQGVATKPEFKFAQESIAKMAAKTIEFEKKKVLQKVESQVEKQAKELADDLKKKAQDLFK